MRPLFVEGRPAGKLVVLHDISRLKRVQRDLFTLATTDALTGLHNRRQFVELARTQIAVATRERMRIALLMIDVDHFKHVNDQHGHAVGDLVLAVVARRIDDGLRRADVTFRYGGEKFAALLSNTDEATASIAAERVRGSVGGETIVVALGVAGDVELADLLLRADQALYSAKAEGRNCVVFFSPEG